MLVIFFYCNDPVQRHEQRCCWNGALEKLNIIIIISTHCCHQVIRDEEQTRANIALKDVKMRIVTEKARELDLLKDALHRKYDTDLHKVTKQKDAEIQKLRNDLKKCQNELSEVSKRGLSGGVDDHVYLYYHSP